jgi:3D (Asp-Asp-Asp) domain-containing protein
MTALRALAAILACSAFAGCDGGAPARPAAAPAPESRVAGDAPAGALGDFWITYYWVEMERDYPGADDTLLVEPSGRPLLKVPKGFADRVCVEGTGVLRDGRVVNIENCSSGYRCAGSNATVCFVVIDAKRFPWGMGSNGNPLVPLRSIAVDNAVIPYGTPLYIEAWDGVWIPEVEGLGGFVHDGRFRADDVGNGVTGKHLDIFSGTPAMRARLEEVFPSDRTTLRVERAAARPR